MFYFEKPELKIIFEIDQFRINLSRNDLEIFWCVLYGNIQNRYDPNEEKVETNLIKRSAFISSIQRIEPKDRDNTFITKVTNEDKPIISDS